MKCSKISVLLFLTAALAVGGCEVGPNFHRPKMAMPADWSGTAGHMNIGWWNFSGAAPAPERWFANSPSCPKSGGPNDGAALRRAASGAGLG